MGLLGWAYEVIYSFTSVVENNDTVLVTLTSGGFDYNLCNADGSDLRFGKSNIDLYSYWIEEWNLGGTSLIHVKIPTTLITSMKGWYGNPLANSISDIYNTFSKRYGDDFSQKQSASFISPQVVYADGKFNIYGTTFKNPLNSNEMIHILRTGVDDGQTINEGKISKLIYNISNKTWGTPTVIYDDPDNDDRNAAGGVVDNNVIVVFLSKLHNNAQPFLNMGYITSLSGGEDWSDYTTITLPASASNFSPYGNVVKTGSIWYQPYYYDTNTNGYTNVYSDTFVIGLLQSLDGGMTWEIGPNIYSAVGPDYRYTEVSVECIGGSNLIAISRNDTNSSIVSQFISIDGGITWTGPFDTNLPISTNSTINGWFLYDNEANANKLLFLYRDRDTSKMYLSISDATTVFNNSMLWNEPLVLPYEFPQTNGYGSIAKMSSNEYFCVYSQEPVTNVVADIWGVVFKDFNINNTDSLPNYFFIQDSSGLPIPPIDTINKEMLVYNTWFRSNTKASKVNTRFRFKSKLTNTTNISQLVGSSISASQAIPGQAMISEKSLGIYYTNYAWYTYTLNNPVVAEGEIYDTNYNTYDIIRSSTDTINFLRNNNTISGTPMVGTIPTDDMYIHFNCYVHDLGESATYKYAFVTNYPENNVTVANFSTNRFRFTRKRKFDRKYNIRENV